MIFKKMETKKSQGFKGFNYTLLQSIIFVIHYGFDKILPWWVLWFPSIILGIIFIIISLFMLCGLIVAIINN